MSDSDDEKFDAESEQLADDIVDLFPGHSFAAVGAGIMIAIADFIQVIASESRPAAVDALDCFRRSLVACESFLQEDGFNDRLH